MSQRVIGPPVSWLHLSLSTRKGLVAAIASAENRTKVSSRRSGGREKAAYTERVKAP